MTAKKDRSPRTMNKLRYVLSFFVLPVLFLFPPASPAEELSELKERIQSQQEEIDSLFIKLRRIEDESESKLGWNLGIFGDVNYSTHSREQASDSFFLGDLTLYSTASYGERLNFLVEIAFEQEEHEADIERVWTGYSVSDMLVVRAGKFHTALGYWNKSYHHGKQLFPTVDRPFFLAFEHAGGVIPIHIAGLEIEGKRRFAFGMAGYRFQFGNGPALVDEDGYGRYHLGPNDTSDNNSSKQPIIRVSLKPSSIRGLSVGAFATTYKVDTTARRGLDERIFGIDISYLHKGLDLTSEWFLLHNSDANGHAFYAQLAYGRDEWTPYLRFERLEIEDNDPYLSEFEMGEDRSQTIIGFRYEMDPLMSSLKFQYRRDEGTRDYNVFETQWAFHF